MKLDKQNYIGRKVILFPNDTKTKIAIIKNIDDLGWTFYMVEGAYGFRTGSTVFFNHSEEINFLFID